MSAKAVNLLSNQKKEIVVYSAAMELRSALQSKRVIIVVENN
jgi:hypothetical protein